MVEFTREELDRMDYKAMIDTAFDDGVAEGIAKGKIEGKIEIAKMMKNSGEPIEKIVMFTGLSEQDIRPL